MSLIHKLNLEKFQPDNKDHIKALKQSKYFELYSNTELFTKMLEDTNFDPTDAEADDYVKYAFNGKIYLGLDTTDLSVDNDDNHYLFDNFNVYYASNNFSYYKIHKTLTKAWRKILKDTYSNTTYRADLKKVLKKELNELIDKFNKDNVDLL